MKQQPAESNLLNLNARVFVKKNKKFIFFYLVRKKSTFINKQNLFRFLEIN